MTPEAAIIQSLFRIPSKEGEDVDFILNTAQRRLDEELTGRDIVPKARQEGVSTYFLGRYLASCLMHRNTSAVVVSHDTESTERLLSRVHYMIDHLKGPAAVVKSKSRNLITFPKMNSAFWIGTAGSREFGRGDTITHLHCSEYAFWPDPKRLMAGLFQAVPLKGEIAIESTGNGYNDYHKRCMRAVRNQSSWTIHFLPWHTFPEYCMDLLPDEEEYLASHLNEDWEEPQLAAQGLTMGQIAWRRLKLEELDYDLSKFKQEYPMTLDECFQMSSSSIFHKVLFEDTPRWERVEQGFFILEGHPQENLHYVQGNDVSAGVGKDSSTSEVFCIETQEQVAEYTNDRIDPEAFGYKVAAIGKMFNECFTVVEQNNHGILTLATLEKIYPSNRIYTEPKGATSSEERQLFGLGRRTTQRNKPLMIGQLRAKLAKEWTIHSTLLKDQLSTFIEYEDGKLAAQEGCEDDLVIAAAEAASGATKAAMSVARPVYKPQLSKMPFILDGMLAELREQNAGFPIPWQHKEH